MPLFFSPSPLRSLLLLVLLLLPALLPALPRLRPNPVVTNKVTFERCWKIILDTLWLCCLCIWARLLSTEGLRAKGTPAAAMGSEDVEEEEEEAAKDSPAPSPINVWSYE